MVLAVVSLGERVHSEESGMRCLKNSLTMVAAVSAVAVLATMLITGCRLDWPQVADVEIRVSLAGPRSIIPDIEAEVTLYEVTLSRTGYDAVTDSGTSGTFDFADLDVGVWTANVDAFNSSGFVVASGGAPIEVSAGGANSATILVGPTQLGSGSVDVTVSWPSADLVDGLLSATLIPEGSAEQSIVDDFVIAATQASWTAELDSGIYTLSVWLGNAAMHVATVIEAVHVCDNVTSVATMELDESEISQPPAAPSGLVATATGTTTVELSWTDNSNVEEGFELQRSDDGWVTSASFTLSGGTTSYADSDLVPGTTYAYRVIAFNDFGESGVSNEASATTEGETATVIINFQNPANPEITFTGNVAQVVRGQLLEVSASAGYAEYTWYLDGDSAAAALSTAGSSATIDTGGLPLGTHSLAVVVSGGYSGQFSFDVVEE